MKKPKLIFFYFVKRKDIFYVRKKSMGDSHLYDTTAWANGSEPWLNVPSPNSWPKVATWGLSSLSSYEPPYTGINKHVVSSPSKLGDSWTNSWVAQTKVESSPKPKIGLEKAGVEVEPLVGDFNSLTLANQTSLEDEFQLPLDESEFDPSFPSSSSSSLAQSPEQKRMNNKKKPNIEEELSKQSLYKTELCRSYQETGTCRYGQKCQFAHGEHELRPILRHPKYKTEYCQRFAVQGHCPYGNRCRFIHPTKASKQAETKKAIALETASTKRNSVPLLDVAKVNETFTSYSNPNSPASDARAWSSTWSTTPSSTPATPKNNSQLAQNTPLKEGTSTDLAQQPPTIDPAVSTSVPPIAPPHKPPTTFPLNPWGATKNNSSESPTTPTTIKSPLPIQLLNENRPQSAEGRRLNVFQNLAT